MKAKEEGRTKSNYCHHDEMNTAILLLFFLFLLSSIQKIRKKDHPVTLLDAAKLTPLSPANVLLDVILPALEKAKIEWLGYHAFRRGLATNLRALSVDDLTIMEILRHSDVAVTRASYIKRVSDKSVEGMDRLAAEIAKPTKVTKGKPIAKNVDVVLPASIA